MPNQAPDAKDPGDPTVESAGEFACEVCDQPFKTAQGLAGHRRLAHSTSTRTELESMASELANRETAAKRREAEVARQAESARQRKAEAVRREQQIAETGPVALGLSQCAECRAWFDTTEARRTHVRRVHPIEDAVAEEVGRSRQRVKGVWGVAARKQEANPDKSSDWVVGQFWSGTDRKILRALLARNASFRFAKEGE